MEKAIYTKVETEKVKIIFDEIRHYFGGLAAIHERAGMARNFLITQINCSKVRPSRAFLFIK
jgi:hypothetical protein